MIPVTIHSTGNGTCALSHRDGDGLTVAFDGEQPLFLSWKSFKQLVSFRLAQRGNNAIVPQPKPTIPKSASDPK